MGAGRQYGTAVTWQVAGGGFSVVELAGFFSRVIML